MHANSFPSPTSPSTRRRRRRTVVVTAAAAIGLLSVGAAVADAGKPAHLTPATAPAPAAVAVPTPATAPTTAAPATTIVPAAPTTPTMPTTVAPPAPVTAPETSEVPATPPPTADPTTAAPTTFTVASVVDGDTIHVDASDGTTAKVRLIGIDAPETGACEATLATETLTSLVDGKAVTLTMGGDGEDTDRYGRLLRYVDVAGQDAGLTLVDLGLARARYDSRDGYGRHDREDTYVAADAASADYTCPVAATAAPVTSAAPRPVADPQPAPPATGVHYANCTAARAAGAAPIYAGEPGYSTKLDRDRDGVACE